MSTMLQEVGSMVRVSTIIGPGNRKKLPRKSTLLPAADWAGIKAEIERQAAEARIEVGIPAK